jgi:hypothetical protein
VSAFMRVALLIQHATRRQLSSAASLAPPHCSALSHKRHNCRKKETEHNMCVLIFFYNFYLKHFAFLG